MTAVQIGALGEALVTAEFAKLGVAVYLPIGDGVTADLIAEFGDRPQRIQVKTSAHEGDKVRFNLQHRIRGGIAPYEDGSLDWYALVSTHHGRVCLIPFVPHESAATIAFKGDAGRARRADEIELSAVVRRMNDES